MASGAAIGLKVEDGLALDVGLRMNPANRADKLADEFASTLVNMRTPLWSAPREIARNLNVSAKYAKREYQILPIRFRHSRIKPPGAFT
jgi:hypothetical protein